MSKNVKLLLEPKDFKPSFLDWEIQGVINPGGIRLKDKSIMLYVRVAESPLFKKDNATSCPIIVSKKKYMASSDLILDKKIIRKDKNAVYLDNGVCRLRNISHFRRVLLDETGYKLKKIENSPVFTGEPGFSEYGVEDPRITRIGNKYYMTYVIVSIQNGVSTCLAESKNLLNWKKRGIIFREQNKDVVLFPEKIKGKYVALNRPESSFVFSKPSIWISYSPDLIFWGKDKTLLRARENSWEARRNGAGPPPIKTKKGWLLIYHGFIEKEGGNIYSAGAALLDLKNPEKIIARSPPHKPLLAPKKSYEKSGFNNNVVFPTTAIPTLDKKSLLIYSGGADSIITVRKLSFEQIFKNMEKVQS